MNLDYLCHLPLFAGVERQDVEWLFSMAEEISVPVGQVLMREGDPGGSLYVVLDGEFQVSKRSGNQDVVIAMRGEGEVFGEMSLLDRSPRSATVRAVRDSRMLMIKQEAFQELLSKSPSATLGILRTMTSRLRNTEAMLRQNEKMAALGTLSAGLAHELNNPAAAARRSAAQLRDTLARLQQLNSELMASLSPEQIDQVNQLRQEIEKRAASPKNLDPLTRSDLESNLQTWLEEISIDEAWELASAFVSFGWDQSALERVTRISEPQSNLLLRWLGAGCLVYGLVDEVGKSAERISEIVKAVKSYSYLDQAPVQVIDIHEGLENTLVMLRHKFKSGVQVVRQYDRELPHIEAYASELNQVWTNIIDNAIDAMKGSGELTLRTFREDSQVVVEIGDNGPGIPPEIQSRIFDPFFTTKAPGIGTGLGLHISFNIVQKHRGSIHVNSRPGATVFQVKLPIRLGLIQNPSHETLSTAAKKEA